MYSKRKHLMIYNYLPDQKDFITAQSSAILAKTERSGSEVESELKS